MVDDPILIGEVCRKIENLRIRVKDLEKEFANVTKELRQIESEDNRELWSEVSKLKEVINECKLNFASFNSSTDIRICEMQRDYDGLATDFREIKTDIKGLREDNKTDNSKVMEVISEIKSASAKNSAYIAILVSIVLFTLSKIFG